MTVSLASLRSEQVIAGLEAAPVEDVGTAIGPGLITGMGPAARSLTERARDRPHLWDWITAEADRTAIASFAVGAEYSTQLQAAINDISTAGGGELQLPSGRLMVGDIILAPKVSLRGMGQPYALSQTDRTILIGPARDCTIIADHATTLCHLPGITDLGIRGNMAYRQKALHFRNSLRPMLERLFIGQMTLEAVHCSLLGRFPHITDCWLFGAQSQTIANAEMVAAVYIDTTEAWITGCEIGSTSSWSEAAIAALGHFPTNAELYHPAVWLGINTADCWIESTITEIGDIGFLNQGSRNKFLSLTADGCFGHGFLNMKGAAGSASSNIFTACHAVRNSRYGTGVYDGINFGDATSTGNQVRGFQAHTGAWVGTGWGTGTFGHRYAAYDGGPDVSSGAGGNYMNGLEGVGLTALYGSSSSNKAGYASGVKGARYISTTGSFTLDASKQKMFRLTAAALAATFTGFTGGCEGDLACVVTVNPQNFTHSATMRMFAGKSIISQAQELLVFFRQVDCWHQIGAVPNMQADLPANFQSLAAAVNTTGKFAGKMMWDLTNLRPLWAIGSLPAHTWKDGAGTVIYTPV